jgi:hypothetical protein
MMLIRRLLFVIVLLSCRGSDGLDDAPIIRNNLRQEKAATADRYYSLDNNNLEQPYQADIAILIEQRTQSIERHNDAHAKPSSRLLQTQSWRTNNNYRNSGINPDGTTGEYYWKDRINRGLRNVGIVIIIWIVVIGFMGMVCRCYLCWESILTGYSLFRYDQFNGDGNHHEGDRLDGVDMPPTSSLDGHQV